MGVATASSTPMPPHGGSPGSGLGASVSSRIRQRSRSRSPLVPPHVLGPEEYTEKDQSPESPESDDPTEAWESSDESSLSDVFSEPF